MIVSIMTVKLYAPWVQSLKEKRMIVKSLCGKLINKFNVSVIESDAQDVHKTIIISIAFLSNNTGIGDSTSEAIQAFIQETTDAEILDIMVEQR
ncbi:MAG: DUF503 domain-containing protein [Anaerovoracaceae bacterium]|nr:DUF503 domain-containing protein [Anaerovoracaceae bacterium]